MRDRERERETQRERDTERDRDRERINCKGSYQGETEGTKSQEKLGLTVLAVHNTLNSKQNKAERVNNKQASVLTFYLFTTDQKYFGQVHHNISKDICDQTVQGQHTTLVKH